jgi:hypothetical protein
MTYKLYDSGVLAYKLYASLSHDTIMYFILVHSSGKYTCYLLLQPDRTAEDFNHLRPKLVYII